MRSFTFRTCAATIVLFTAAAVTGMTGCDGRDGTIPVPVIPEANPVDAPPMNRSSAGVEISDAYMHLR